MTGRWPWPGDNATERARRIANSLLALLPAEERPVWTTRAHQLGETWLGETIVGLKDDDAITGRQAAQLVHVSEDVIRKWASMPHPDAPDRKLLPRFKKLGGRRTYIVQHVLDAAAAIRRTRQKHEERAA